MTDQARAAYEALTRDLTEDELDRVATLLNDQERGEIGFQGLIETILAEFGELAAHEPQSTLHNAACDVPGLRNVPVEPTDAMAKAGAQYAECGLPANAVFGYRAMLAAAPAQPAAGLVGLTRRAARYDWIRSNAWGERDNRGRQQFVFPDPHPLADIMRGSVAQHLDAAIDAEITRALAQKDSLTNRETEQ